jgi:hypothetical protein
MSLAKRFNTAEISLVNKTFNHAEKLAEGFFRFSSKDWQNHRYHVKTLAHLEIHEVNDRAFAHLCKYCFEKEKEHGKNESDCFYRICLQDNRILHAVERGSSFIKLIPLMLYIATHELVHIIRFNNGEGDFEAPIDEKVKEEEKVNAITRTILQPHADRDLNLVIDCFSDRYHIGDIFN